MPLKPIYRDLPAADDSLFFFEQLKQVSEKYWETIILYDEIWGYQIQPGSKWKKGLNDHELKEFEKAMGFSFPEPLRNFYRTMNGLTLPAVNLCGGEDIKYGVSFFSFPDDIDEIKSYIDWIYQSNSIDQAEAMAAEISRIFPVYSHRFMLVDVPGNPVLSMYGDDIIHWTDNISKLLIKEIFKNVLTSNARRSLYPLEQSIKFWLE